jgi:hypothetical protein
MDERNIEAELLLLEYARQQYDDKGRLTRSYSITRDELLNMLKNEKEIILNLIDQEND